ncbi:BAI1-associated protein 3-like isoform X2 [Tubulanus polymorphus]|uniref:BAI1-associated protein 3-like isoform X2 n=1 Tax=Tubulanus polymorphus TaxID=672921 RepID=UPI003DA43CA0
MTSASSGDCHSIPDHATLETKKEDEDTKDEINSTSTQEEDTYKAVLKSLMFPLGTASGRKGYTPNVLIENLQTVFEMDDTKHQTYYQEEEEMGEMRSCVLNIRVIEGRDLISMDSNGLSDPYCQIRIVREKLRKITGGSSPHSKHKESKHHPEPEFGECRRTKVVHESLQPKWNEEFDIELSDYKNEMLEVYVWDNDDGMTIMDSVKQLEGTSGLKSVVRTFRQTVEFGKPVDDLIGSMRIPLKNVSAKGMESWFDIHQRVSNKNKKTGQIKLLLELKYPQIASIQDSVESDQHHRVFPVEQYYTLITKIIEHTAKKQQEAGEELDRKLCPQTEMILEQFAVPNNISRVTRALLKLIALLELAVDMDKPPVKDSAIKDAIVQIEMDWMQEQLRHEGLGDTFIVSDWELSKFDEASSAYVHRIIKDISDIPHLFPPDEENLEAFNSKVSLIVTLLNIHLWSSNPSSKKDLTALIAERIKMDAKSWMESKLNTIHSDAKDAVLPKIEQLTQIINEATTAIVPNYTYTQFFSGRLGIDYYKYVSIALDSKLAGKTKELMIEMDKYLIRYHKFPENIMQSSKVSLMIYFALRGMFYQFRENVSERDVFKLSLSKFYDWFMESLVFWLQTFRSEATRRMEKALEIDKDVVVVTTLVKYSNSSVDVLSCFDKMITEWVDIGYVGADNNIMGITKICDTICDGARMYADKIRFILEKNGYYDNDNEQFDVTDQLCITLNNIEHVRRYLNELPQKLNWEENCKNMAIAHENDELGVSSLKTLTNLVSDANKDMSMKSKTLICSIIDKMSVDIIKNIELFAIKEPNKRNSIDPLLQYLESNLGKLYQRLESSIFPKMLDEIWETVVNTLNTKLLKGKLPEYYAQMKRRLDSLKQYFMQGGCEDEKLKTLEYLDLHDRIKINSHSTNGLLLQYFEGAAADMQTPIDYFGHLAVKVAYQEETRGNITLFVKVISANELPGLDSSGLSDPYVVVQLSPFTLFPMCKPQRTITISKTLNPVFNHTFQFNCIPKDHLSMKGAVIHFKAMDYDFLLPDDFAGETFICLNTVRQIKSHETCDVVPAVMMPVKRPNINFQTTCFEVLCSRMSWDKDAKRFINERRILFENQKERTDIKDTNDEGDTHPNSDACNCHDNIDECLGSDE